MRLYGGGADEDVGIKDHGASPQTLPDRINRPTLS